MAKKTTAKKKTTTTKSNLSKKFSFTNELHGILLSSAAVTKKGEIKFNRTELKKAVETIFETGLKRAAGGERVRFPIIGTLVRRDVKERKSGKGVNPFTGEAITIKARPASKKPKWSFPKTVKETFSDKKNW